MPRPTDLVFTDNPGDLPATYTIPPGVGLILASVVARFDGTGAAGNFLPTLDLLAQDGKLMARVAVNQTLTPGDSGVVTWAPFLRRQAAAAPASAALEMGYCTFDIDQTFTGTGDHILSWDSVYVPVGQSAIQVGASATNPFTFTADGVYAVTFNHHWTTAFAAQHFGHIDSTVPAEYPTNPIYGASMPTLDTAQNVVVPNWTFQATIPPLNNAITFFIFLGAGAGTRTLTGASAIVHYLGASNGTIP